MDYQKVYNNIINNRKQKAFNGYTEKHHIIPKSLGGKDNKANLVELSAREHFICHLLLTKMYKEGTIQWIKMCKAFMNMFRHGNHKRYCPSKWYAYCREQFCQAQSLNQAGKGNSQYNKKWIYNPTIRQCKFINHIELQNYLNNGWQLGRINNWEKYELVQQGYDKTYSIDKIKQLQINVEKRQIKKQQQLKLCKEYYEIYNKYGWEYFKEHTNYPYSKQNLVMMFKRLLPEFKPQNGKKRGK